MYRVNGVIRKHIIKFDSENKELYSPILEGKALFSYTNTKEEQYYFTAPLFHSLFFLVKRYFNAEHYKTERTDISHYRIWYCF